MENPEKEVQNEKPKFLYHGSPDSTVEEFEPRTNPKRGEEPGVYATQDLAVALMFMHKNLGQSGFFGDTYFAILFGSREECLQNDHGGCVYVFDSETFEINGGRGLGKKEWVSRTPVKPIRKMEYPSTIDAAIASGVQVYIFDRSKYSELHHTEDHGRSILRASQSENQRRGINVKPL